MKVTTDNAILYILWTESISVEELRSRINDTELNLLKSILALIKRKFVTCAKTKSVNVYSLTERGREYTFRKFKTGNTLAYRRFDVASDYHISSSSFERKTENKLIKSKGF